MILEAIFQNINYFKVVKTETFIYLNDIVILRWMKCWKRDWLKHNSI